VHAVHDGALPMSLESG